MPPAIRFGPFVIDRASYRLLRDDEPIEVSPKVLDLLFLFADRPGALVTKDDMLAALWPGIAVTDNALTQVVSDLRRALGDEASQPRYVETVPRRGYRFIGEIDRAVPETAAGIASRPEASPGGMRSVAVGDFTNLAKDAGVAWLAAGIAETVANALRAFPEVVIGDREGPGRVRPPASDIIISGGYQRSGDALRVTAQAVDARTQQTLASAKADGLLADVFAVQDALVAQLVSGLQLGSAGRSVRPRARETSSLEAYRAVTEGRLKLETLELADVPGALADFERAIRLDPHYALAYVGLAHARFWKFQASRTRLKPDRDDLAAALAHARQSVELDPELAEGHAALALFLAAAERRREAVTAGRIAVALEPANWRHQFRLGIAAWGSERLAALETVIARYPVLPYANVGIAMVHVARGQMDVAESVLKRGLQSESAGRFPGRGLHWLLGVIRLAGGDADRAAAEFQREASAPSGAVHADEYGIDALNGLGFVRLADADHDAAVAAFGLALDRQPDHPTALAGLAQALLKRGHRDRAASVLAQASRSSDELEAAGRISDAALARAHCATVSGRRSEAVAGLAELLRKLPMGPAGWSLPIEPWLAAERGSPEFAEVLAILAERAR